LEILRVLETSTEGKSELAEKYKVSESHIRQIEMEGLSKDWSTDTSMATLESGAKQKPTPIPTGSQETTTLSNSTEQSSGCVTKGDHIAAISEEWYEEATKYLFQDDMVALQKLIDANVAFVLKEGISVQLVKTKMLKGRVEIRPVGFVDTIWTSIEAVTCN
jgi:hypothetical protein